MNRVVERSSENVAGPEGISSCLLILIGVLAAFLYMPQGAIGHAGHVHTTTVPDHAEHNDPARPDGRISGLPSFVERLGNGTTYTYRAVHRDYRVTTPGEPPVFIHGDPIPPGDGPQSAGVVADEVSDPGDTGEGSPGEENELAPVCRTSGHRVVIVSSYFPGQFKDYTSKLRQIVRRMTWKIADQASKSSSGTRPVRMAVDCNEQGEIAIHYVEVESEAMGTLLGAGYKVYGKPESNGPTEPSTPSRSVVYLNFAQQADTSSCGCAGLAAAPLDSSPGPDNWVNQYTHSGAVAPAYWEYLTPVHELLHTMGAVNGTAPYGAGQAHCADGLDVMCYQDAYMDPGEYTSTRCPKSAGFNTWIAKPIDCGTDTYFDSVPTPGTWLASHWNLAAWPNAYLVAEPKLSAAPASEVHGTFATLNANVDPEGADTHYYFDWAPYSEYPTKGYTHTTPGDLVSRGEGNSFVLAGEVLAGLKPGSTYIFRPVIENEAAKVTGEPRQFTTPTSRLIAADQLNVAVEGESSGENHVLQFPASSYGTISCAAPPELYDESLEGGTSALALDGSYGGCSNSQTLKMNGCKLIFHTGSGSTGDTPSTGNTVDTAEIGPSGCGPVTITGSYCKYEIGAQNGIAASVDNMTQQGNEYLRAEIEATGLSYTTSGISSCHPGIYTNGSYTGAWTIKALDPSVGYPVDIRVSNMAAGAGKFYAGAHPAKVTGSQLASDPLVFGFKDGVTAYCENADFSGLLGAAAQSLFLGASYSECEVATFTNGQFKMNSCSYNLNASLSPPLTGTVDIACSKTGDAIEIAVAGLCSFKIGPQQKRGTISLQNSAAGVTANFKLKDLTYEAFDQSFFCPLNGGGTFSNGTYNGTIALSAEGVAATEAVTSEAEVSGPHTATLHGKVFRENKALPTTFEYGTTTGYGSQVAGSAVPLGSGWYQVSAQIKTLSPATTYHYRLVTTDELGSHNGADVTLKTPTDTFVSKARYETQAAYPADLAASGGSVSVPMVMTLEGGTFTCTNTSLRGELAGASQSLTLEPWWFGGCSLLGASNPTVTVNGCQYRFWGGEGATGTMGIVCPEGKAIEVASSACKISIPAQTSLTSVEPTTAQGIYQEEVVKLDLNVVGLHYTKVTDATGCPLNGTGAAANGSYSGLFSFEAFSTGEQGGGSLDFGFAPSS